MPAKDALPTGVQGRGLEVWRRLLPTKKQVEEGPAADRLLPIPSMPSVWALMTNDYPCTTRRRGKGQPGFSAHLLLLQSLDPTIRVCHHICRSHNVPGGGERGGC